MYERLSQVKTRSFSCNGCHDCGCRSHYSIRKTFHSQAADTDLYVNATTGNYSNNSSQSTPFATINQAAPVAQERTTVQVAPGIYSQPVTTNPSGKQQPELRRFQMFKGKQDRHLFLSLAGCFFDQVSSAIASCVL